MSLADQNCPKCGHTLESVNVVKTECWNANCDLRFREDLVEYCKENNIRREDIRR